MKLQIADVIEESTKGGKVESDVDGVRCLSVWSENL